MAQAVNLRAHQAAQTQARILDAAAAELSARGFAGARFEDIADAANVAVPTVYKVFGNKRNLLAAVVHRAMAGTDDSEPVDRQAWFQEQLDEPDPAGQLELVARNARRLYDRAGALLEAVRAAALSDDDVATIWAGINDERTRRAQQTGRVFLHKAGRRARLSHAETATTLYALTEPALYTAQLAAGRSAKQYERWLADVLIASLLR